LWQKEAFLFLRNRGRGLILRDYGTIKDIVAAAPHRLVFEDSGIAAGFGPSATQSVGKDLRTSAPTSEMRGLAGWAVLNL
jgi:hypothetical protein